MDIQGIKDFVQLYSLEERSYVGFWKYFNNYKKECSQEFNEEFPDYNENDVELFMDSVSLRITNWPDDGYNHVVTTIRMHYKDSYAALYQMIFNLSGEVEDDHLSL
ncbi:hypothetical protein [Paenibacillus xylanilyticus]|uniref:Uncharacterized protein n=1 Tax=Paenibacillus xylanilyticus TaxID=248903 RepID=A0A7Y6BUT1_9BACL|nr:hypothetical protein [Paenibacillus xylanilyticus]NUU74359.1 hypothetical protein [Paenibacillus xylanilyticus]